MVCIFFFSQSSHQSLKRNLDRFLCQFARRMTNVVESGRERRRIVGIRVDFVGLDPPRRVVLLFARSLILLQRMTWISCPCAPPRVSGDLWNIFTQETRVFFSFYLHFKSSFHNLSSLSPPIAMRKVGGSISWRSVTAIWNLLSETVDIRQLAAQEWKWNEWWRIREKERETCDKLKVSDRITGRKNPDVASTCFFGWKTTLAQGSWKKDLRATPSCCCWGLFLNKPNIWVKYTRVAIYDHSTRILC